MRKDFRTIMTTIWYKSFWQNICPVENRILWPPSKRHNSKTWGSSTRYFSSSPSLSLSVPLSQEIKFLESIQKILILLYIEPGNQVSDLAFMGHSNFVFFFFLNNKKIYQIWHSWFITLWAFYLNKFFFSIFLFSFIFIFYLFLFFDRQRWATILLWYFTYK